MGLQGERPGGGCTECPGAPRRFVNTHATKICKQMQDDAGIVSDQMMRDEMIICWRLGSAGQTINNQHLLTMPQVFLKLLRPLWMLRLLLWKRQGNL